MIKLIDLLKEQEIRQILDRTTPQGGPPFALAATQLQKKYSGNGFANANIPTFVSAAEGKFGFRTATDYRFNGEKQRIAYCGDLAAALKKLSESYLIPAGQINSIQAEVNNPAGENNEFRFIQAAKKMSLGEYVQPKGWLISYFKSNDLAKLLTRINNNQPESIAVAEELCSNTNFQQNYMTPIVRVYQGITLPQEGGQTMSDQVKDLFVAMDETGFYSTKAKRTYSITDINRNA